MSDNPFPEVAGVPRSMQRAIFHAMRAGAFWKASRDVPASRDTFLAAAPVNSAKATSALSKAIRDLPFDCKDHEP